MADGTNNSGGIRLEAPRIDAEGNSNYAPCRTGLHFCGVTPDNEQPYSAANIDATSFWNAQEMFKAARRVGECSKEEADFCVDLMLGGDCETDFWSNRQLFPAILAEIARLNATRPADLMGRGM